MPWSEDEGLKLLQLQVPVALIEKIDELAKEDRRSRTQESVYLLEEGLKRVERNRRLVEEADQTYEEEGKRQEKSS